MPEIEEVGVATVLKPGSSLLLCCALMDVVLNGMGYGAIPLTATNKQASWMMEFSLISFESQCHSQNHAGVCLY
jgi:hypothetical protein